TGVPNRLTMAVAIATTAASRGSQYLTFILFLRDWLFFENAKHARMICQSAWGYRPVIRRSSAVIQGSGARLGTSEPERPQQMGLERLRCRIHRGGPPQLGQLSHLQPLIATGIDASKGPQIHIHVQGQSVIARVPPDADPHAPQLPAPYIHPGSTLPRLRDNSIVGGKLDHALLESGDNCAHTQVRAPQINQRINDQLPRTVIGHLATSVDLNDGDITWSQHVVCAGVHPERKHRGMFEKPDFVRSG